MLLDIIQKVTTNIFNFKIIIKGMQNYESKRYNGSIA